MLTSRLTRNLTLVGGSGKWGDAKAGEAGGRGKGRGGARKGEREEGGGKGRGGARKGERGSEERGEGSEERGEGSEERGKGERGKGRKGASLGGFEATEYPYLTFFSSLVASLWMAHRSEERVGS